MAHETNNPYQSSFGSIVQINFRLLLAFSFTFIGWWIWPDTALGWGWGFLAILLFTSSLGLFIEAIKAMTKLYVNDVRIGKYTAQGSKPKSAKLASDDALRNSGMIDG